MMVNLSWLVVFLIFNLLIRKKNADPLFSILDFINIYLTSLFSKSETNIFKAVIEMFLFYQGRSVDYLGRSVLADYLGRSVLATERKN